MKEALTKTTLGLLAVVLLLFAGGLYVYGSMERFDVYIEKVENTAYEKRAAVSEAYRESWGIDKWSIGAFLCFSAALASAVAAFRLPKHKPTETT